MLFKSFKKKTFPLPHFAFTEKNSRHKFDIILEDVFNIY